MFDRLRSFLRITESGKIARRYFVTNGFDGVLATLGLLMGFRVNVKTSLDVIIGACLGAAVALFMSGITSAYISESAEKERELRLLEQSMIASLDHSVHGQAARLMPWVIALINGLSPFCLALLVMFPLFIAEAQLFGDVSPLDAAIAVALLLTFLLGVYSGRLGGRFWLWSGLRSLMIAAITAIIIFVLNRGLNVQ